MATLLGHRSEHLGYWHVRHSSADTDPDLLTFLTECGLSDAAKAVVQA